MPNAKPLPDLLVARYHDWKSGTYAEKRDAHVHLAEVGQTPRALVISCCDSRVDPLSILGADHGEFFVHRNIANLVPPFGDAQTQNGTPAVLEYGITALKIPHIIVMGHSSCGGVKGCLDMCAGRAPQLEEDGSFVGRWIDTLRPAVAKVAEIDDPAAQANALEEQGVLLSLDNLMTYPFIAQAVEAGTLSLHGLRADIATGELTGYNPASETFEPL